MKNPRERIIIAIILLALIFISYSFVVSSASEFKLSARSAVLYEPSEKKFLFSKNGDEKLPMASTTKIMTALVALEELSLDNMISIPKNAVGTEGSSLYLKEGEELSALDLLYGLMLRSANDAAVAIACAVSGSVESFAQLMNKKAYEIGVRNTNFENPHGLDSDRHYTTAEDLAIISAAALENETFKNIVSTKKIIITNSDNESRLIINHNKLLNMYDGAMGVKTGFTKKCGRCLVGAAERDGLTLISVTINAPDDWNDHIKLFDYGFSKMKKVCLAKRGQFTYSVPIIEQEKELTVSNSSELFAITSANDSEIKTYVDLPKFISGTVRAGDIIGSVTFTVNGERIGSIDLVAMEDINKTNKRKFFIF